jgi:hypothetical protein
MVTIWLILVCLTLIVVASRFATAPELRSITTDRLQCVSDGRTMHCVLRQMVLPHGMIEPRSAPRLPAAELEI